MKPANDAAAIAREAAEKANSAAQQAKDEADKLPGIATNLQNAIDTAEATNSEIKSNESERLKSEQKRENSESARVAAETERANAEILRESAESRRGQAENERQSNEEQRISTFNTFKTTIDSKQDAIADLAEIRSGASKGATALQSYTETDPVYMADKPSLATKKELATKQDTLIPGNGISIEGNVIGVTAITESESQPDTSLWLNPSEDEETDVTYNRSQIDAMVGAKQDTLTLTVKDNGNIVLSNIQGQSKEFMPATPSGDPMHYAYEAAGAVWNGTGTDIVKTGEFTGEEIIHKSGYWYYNELGNISNDQMRAIYVVGNRLFSGNASSMAYAFQKIRTNLFTNTYNQGSWIPIDLYSIAISFEGETLRLCESAKANIIYAGRIDRSFSGASKLKKILGNIYLRSNYSDYTSIFDRCYALEYVRLNRVCQNLSLSNSSYLQESSILYMIQNETATSAITITLHADAYARAMANADIVAALEAHPNVSLASA